MAITASDFALQIKFSLDTNTFFVQDLSTYNSILSPLTIAQLHGKSYAKLLDPSGNTIFNKFNIGSVQTFIDFTVASNSAEYVVPLDQNGNIPLGNYTFYYTLVYDNPAGGAPIQVDKVFTLVVAQVNKLKPVLTVTSDASYGPTGLLTAVDNTNYNVADTTSENDLTLYYPQGLPNNPAPLTGHNISTFVTQDVATGTWTCRLSVVASYVPFTNIDNTSSSLWFIYTAVTTVLHTVSNNDSLCGVNTCIDDVIASFNQAINSASNPSRYLNQLTLINSYYTQMQIEQSCGNGDKAQDYANKILAMAGVESSCSCGDTCGGSCGDITPEWINNSGAELGGYKLLSTIITPAGTNDPDWNDLFNTIGSYELSRTASNTFNLSFFNSVVVQDKLMVFLTGPSTSTPVAYQYVSATTIQLKFSETAGSANRISLEVRIYN